MLTCVPSSKSAGFVSVKSVFKTKVVRAVRRSLDEAGDSHAATVNIQSGSSRQNYWARFSRLNLKLNKRIAGVRTGTEQLKNELSCRESYLDPTLDCCWLAVSTP